MSKNSEHHDTYIIPPNFIEGSTLFGGMFKIPISRQITTQR